MTTYRMKVSFKNAATTIHSPTCRVVINKTRKHGVFEVEADSAAKAAQEWHEMNDGTERGLEVPRICGCCGEG